VHLSENDLDELADIDLPLAKLVRDAEKICSIPPPPMEKEHPHKPTGT